MYIIEQMFFNYNC